MDPGAVVVAGRASPTFARNLAKALGCSSVETELRTFPDGEVYTRIVDEVRDKHVVLATATATNDAFVEALLLQDAAREAGAARITTVLPYVGYARQDRVFKAGEAISSRAVALAIATTTDEVLMVDPHKEEILDFYPCPATSVSAVKQICQRLATWDVDLVLAPDKGARGRAAAAAKILEVPFDHLEKTRLSATQVRMEAKDLDVSGHKVAILDDMIASGGTMKTAAGHLKDQGAALVVAACTHGVFTHGAVQAMRNAGIDHVLCTDTLEVKEAETVSAAPAVAEALTAQGLA